MNKKCIIAYMVTILSVIIVMLSIIHSEKLPAAGERFSVSEFKRISVGAEYTSLYVVYDNKNNKELLLVISDAKSCALKELK